VHDAVDLEGRGIPTLVVASAPFVDAAAAQAGALGMPDVRRVFVAHPVQDRTDEEMVALADEAYARVVAALTAQGSS
jgi:alkanesulfonate monooxygenase SsuD/methylene tetrahydromethanopterin reductase-like flavin-dependent oxidoreductase (luciferase family)